MAAIGAKLGEEEVEEDKGGARELADTNARLGRYAGLAQRFGPVGF